MPSFVKKNRRLYLTFLFISWNYFISGVHTEGLTSFKLNAPKKLIQQQTTDRISLTCLMIVRDEAENLSKNLPLWGRNFFDAYVIAIDDRTIDNTSDVLNHYIQPETPRYIFKYNFTNFGKARTECLQAAYEQFSHISHIFMIDPDWRPNMTTIKKSDLELDVEAYQFKIWDRSGVSVRYANWLALNQKNLSFAYYVSP